MHKHILHTLYISFVGKYVDLNHVLKQTRTSKYTYRTKCIQDTFVISMYVTDSIIVIVIFKCIGLCLFLSKARHMSVERLNTGVLKVLTEAKPFLSVRIWKL